MTIAQTRRRFLTTLSLAGAAGLCPRSAALAAESAARNDDSASLQGPCDLRSAADTSPRSCCAPRALPISAMWIRPPDDLSEAVAQRQGRFRSGFCVDVCSRRSMPAKPITVLAGVHVGCFELFGNEGIRSIADLKGKTVGVQALGSTPHALLGSWPPRSGSIPIKDIHWVTDPSVKPMELFADGKIDAFLGFPPEPQDLRARQDRPRRSSTARWTARGRNISAACLSGNRGLRPQISGRDQTRAARHSQGHRSLRQPTRRASRDDSSMAVSPPRYDYALQTLQRAALRQMARIRPRGHDPVLCAAPARSGHDQIEPAEDHRRRHRLALSRTSSNAS